MRKKKMLFALAGFACLSIALTSCEDFLNRVKNPNGNTTETTDTGDDNNPTGDNTPTGEDTPSTGDDTPTGGDTPSTGDDTPTGGDTPSTGDDTPTGEDTPTEDTSKLLLTIKRDTVPNVVSNVETGIYPLVSSEESINGVDFIFSEDVGVSTNYKDYSPLQIRAKSKAYADFVFQSTTTLKVSKVVVTSYNSSSYDSYGVLDILVGGVSGRANTTTSVNGKTRTIVSTYTFTNSNGTIEALHGDSAMYVGTIDIYGSITGSSTPSEDPTPSDHVERTYDHFYKAESTINSTINYQALQKSQECDSINTISTTKKKFLVIPIEIKGYSFASQTLNDLDNLFNGNGKTDTGYWESLSSYYKKTSFGKFNSEFVIADVYKSNKTPQEILNYKGSDGQTEPSTMILRDAIADYKAKNGNDSTKQFDTDSDGLIDATIMIYSCPNYTNSTAISKIDDEGTFWAYCFWDYMNNSNANKNSPVANNYFWSSYDFNYDAVTSPKVDSHTICHEFGHLLGLDDYYDYSKEQKRAPAGGFDMMDMNIGDHSTFSKMALGWTKPYVVTGDAEITINPASENGDCILLGNGWNGTAFDEYLLFELYTPTGLNELDSTTTYFNRFKLPSTPGIKLWHIDARIYRADAYDENDNGTTLTTLPTTLDTSKYCYGVAATNSTDYDSAGAANKNYDLIRLIEKTDSGINSSADKTASSKSLWTTGNKFTMSAKSTSFPNKTKLNNGKTLDYTVEFKNVTSTSATLRFTKN